MLLSATVVPVYFSNAEQAEAATGPVEFDEPRYESVNRGELLMYSNSLIENTDTAFNGRDYPTQAQEARNRNNTNIDGRNSLQLYSWQKQPVDIDNREETSNSSSVTIDVPGNAEVKWAGLYWAANSYDLNKSVDSSVLFTDAGGSDHNVSPESTATIDSLNIGSPDRTNGTGYHNFADVTSIVQNSGNGSYTLGNIPFPGGLDSPNYDAWAGWNLIIVTDDEEQPYRSFSIFDGYEYVSRDNPGVTVDLNNAFNVPQSGVPDARMVYSGYEGDAFISGDSLAIEDNDSGGFESLSAGSIRPENDFFTQAITVDDSYQANERTQNPSYTNSFGMDAASLNLDPSYFANGQTDARFRATTEGDSYIMSNFGFAVDVGSTKVTLEFTDDEGNTLDTEEITGNPGDEYTVDPPDIDGYETPSEPVTGTFGEEDSNVPVVYEQDAVEGGSVTAEYVDQDGNPIAENEVVTGNVDESYDTDAKEIDGYTLKDYLRVLHLK